MAAADEVLVSILASPAQVAHRFVRRRRWMDLGQKPCPVEFSQLACVATIRLDPIPGLTRDQRRCDHYAHGPRLLDPALQRVAAGPRLVAEAHLVARR